MLEPGAKLPDGPGLFFAVAPARRGFVWRELGLVLLPDHAGLPPPRPEGAPSRRSRAAVVRRSAHGRLRRPRGPRRRQAARLRDEGGRRRHTRLPPARLPRRRPPLRPARADSAASRASSARTRRRPRSRSSAARRGSCSGRARASRCTSSPSELIALYAQRQTQPGNRLRPEQRVAAAARGLVPVSRDARPGERDRGGEGGSRGRRARWTGSSAAMSASARRRSPCERRSPSR